jgi:integrase
LFPELPYQNSNYGHTASKWFGRFKKKCGIDSDKLVFHSLRHTLTNNLKQQLITETLIDELTGHAIQGETMGRYGKRYEIKVLFEEAVMKLDYSGVDLEHLKDSKWTG